MPPWTGSHSWFHVCMIKPSLPSLPTFPTYLTYLTYITYLPNSLKHRTLAQISATGGKRVHHTQHTHTQYTHLGGILWVLWQNLRPVASSPQSGKAPYHSLTLPHLFIFTYHWPKLYSTVYLFIPFLITNDLYSLQDILPLTNYFSGEGKLESETHTQRQAIQHGCLPSLLGDGDKGIEIVYGGEKIFGTGLTTVEQPRQDKSPLVPERRAQRTNQGRTPFICTLQSPHSPQFQQSAVAYIVSLVRVQGLR